MTDQPPADQPWGPEEQGQAPATPEFAAARQAEEYQVLVVLANHYQVRNVALAVEVARLREENGALKDALMEARLAASERAEQT